MSSDIAARLQADVITAMKAKDKERLGVLRQMQAAVKQVQIDTRAELDDDGVLKVFMAYAKKVRDSLESAEKAGREDLAAGARAEQAIVQNYLPAAMADDELAAIVDTVIAETGASSPKEMGVVIKGVMAQVKGAAEGSRVSAMVKSKLVG